MSIQSYRSPPPLSPKRELALFLSCNAVAPKGILKDIFDQNITQLEHDSRTTFDRMRSLEEWTIIRNKTWKSFSRDKLPDLKEIFIYDYCDTILGKFNNDQIKECCLALHMAHNNHPAILMIAIDENEKIVLENTKNTALRMTQDWKPKIAQALRNAGVEECLNLPIPDIEPVDYPWAF